MSTKKKFNWVGLLIIIMTLLSPYIVDKVVDKMFERGEE